MMPGQRRLAADRRGGVGVMFAAALPLLIGMAAFAVDYGTMELDARRLQGVADAAALAAAARADAPDAAARDLVAASWPRAATVRTTTGAYAADAALSPTKRFAAGTGDAVQVEVASTSPLHFAAIFGSREVRVVRLATAQRRQVAAFAIGSRLVGLDAGLLNAVLGGLIGTNVSLGIADYRAMSDAGTDVFALLDRLKLRAALSVNNYGELLAAQVSTADVFLALADTLDADGSTAAGGAVRRLAAAVPARRLALAALIDAGPLARQDQGGAGIARVPALAFVAALLETGGARQLALDLGATLPGLASLKVMVALGERAQQSPWLSVADRGQTVVRTAQARLYVRARLQPTLLPGLSGLAAIDLPLFVQLAGAEARLRAIDCAASPHAVTLEAKVDPLDAAIGTVDEAKLGDFSTVLNPATAKLIDTLLVDVTGSSRVSLGAAEPWQTLRYARPAIDARTPQTIRGTTLAGGITASLLTQASLNVQLLGLAIPVDPVIRAVGALLAPVAPPLDTLLQTVTGALGLGIGEADVTVNGLRCGGAVLVG